MVAFAVMKKHGVIVAWDGRIAAVGHTAAGTIPEGATGVDLRNPVVKISNTKTLESVWLGSKKLQ